MPVEYKIDVLSELKNAGYSTYRLRHEKILGERVIQQLRNSEPVSWLVLGRICELLHLNVGDIITYTSEKVCE